jgi:hypothetical protein
VDVLFNHKGLKNDLNISDMETEIKLQYGKKPDKFKKDYWEMSPELQEEYKKWQEMNIRENIFSRNQPLVYRRASDNKMIAEYNDGKIEFID